MKVIYACFLIALSSISITVKAQLIQWKIDQPLVWTDFKGPVDENVHHDAYTHCLFNHPYHWDRHNGKYKFSFKMISGFDMQTSWCRPGKQTDLLLQHEQLHFDIHELYARKMYKALNDFTYDDDYINEIKAIADRITAQAQAMQNEYDTDTNHSRNKDKQLEWEAKVKQELQKTPPYLSA